MELVNLKTEQVENTIYCLGDMHEGASNMNENALRKAIRLISATGAMWLGMLKISIIANARRKDQCKLSLEKIYL